MSGAHFAQPPVRCVWVISQFCSVLTRIYFENISRFENFLWITVTTDIATLWHQPSIGNRLYCTLTLGHLSTQFNRSESFEWWINWYFFLWVFYGRYFFGVNSYLLIVNRMTKKWPKESVAFQHLMNWFLSRQRSFSVIAIVHLFSHRNPLISIIKLVSLTPCKWFDCLIRTLSVHKITDEGECRHWQDITHTPLLPGFGQYENV